MKLLAIILWAGVMNGSWAEDPGIDMAALENLFTEVQEAIRSDDWPQAIAPPRPPPQTELEFSAG